MITKSTSDPDRIDVDVVHTVPADDYWAEGRERETTEITVKNSLCFGGYLSGQQVAFGRVVTDRAIIGYLADIFVLPRVPGPRLWQDIGSDDPRAP